MCNKRIISLFSALLIALQFVAGTCLCAPQKRHVKPAAEMMMPKMQPMGSCTDWECDYKVIPKGRHVQTTMPKKDEISQAYKLAFHDLVIVMVWATEKQKQVAKQKEERKCAQYQSGMGRDSCLRYLPRLTQVIYAICTASKGRGPVVDHLQTCYAALPSTQHHRRHKK